MVKTWHFHCSGPRSTPGQGSKIPKATLHDQKNLLKELKEDTEEFKKIMYEQNGNINKELENLRRNQK